MDYDALKAFTNNEIEPYLHNIEMWQCITALGIKPFKDGNQWSFLYGENIQEGICGFGGTKEEALIAFIKELIEERDKKSVDKLKVSDEPYEHIRNTCACIDDALSTNSLVDMTDYVSMADYSAKSAFDIIEKQGEQKPIFDVEIPFGAKDSELEEVFYSIPNGFHAEIKDDKVVIKKGEKKYWSEEVEAAITLLKDIAEEQEKDYCPHNANDLRKAAQYLETCRPQNTCKPSGEHHELEEFAKIIRCNLTGISKSVQKLFEAKYLQLTGNKMYEGFKD